MRNYLTKKYILIIFLLFISSHCFALTSKVVLTGGGTSKFRKKVEFRLTKIVNSLDVHRLDRAENYLTEEGDRKSVV